MKRYWIFGWRGEKGISGGMSDFIIDVETLKDVNNWFYFNSLDDIGLFCITCWHVLDTETRTIVDSWGSDMQLGQTV